MNIPIKTDKKKFYRQALTIVSSIPPFNKLRTKELEVLAWLSYYFNEFKQVFGENLVEDINNKLFDYNTKVKIREQIQDRTGKELSLGNLNNIMMGLKKKGFILEKGGNKTLNTKYLFDPNKIESITYKFNFNGK